MTGSPSALLQPALGCREASAIAGAELYCQVEKSSPRMLVRCGCDAEDLPEKLRHQQAHTVKRFRS